MGLNAKHDENHRPTLIAVSLADGVTIVQGKAHPSKHALEVDNNTTGSDNGNNGGNAMLDENSVPVWMALSSANDDSIVEVYANADTSKILINSN
jgi:hypothetical protein